ncbi:MAG: AbrB/MazE/SpoVT family DNA-binding domain-containing protein [Desulfuromonadales bacterium]|nr:AbrB/MazE/SpoVT family DNA-binding domain-containing protein [Desulfuromonadales bacterium]
MSQAETVLDIKQWGNNLGVRLPQAIARAANLHRDQRVRVAVEGGRVVITPVTGVTPTLNEMITSFDPTRHGGEVMITKAVGVEEW